MADVKLAHDWVSALDLVSDDVLSRLDGPPEKVRGLPSEAFTSPEFFALEQQRLFPRCWTFAGVASEVPEAGDVRPLEVAGQPLILIRGHDGQLRVFHNVCPHRGAKLIDAPANAQAALTCVYHAWTYDLDGRLRARPHYDGPGRHDSGGGDGAEHVCLFPVRSHTWHDWVFVDLEGKAPAFGLYMSEALARLAPYDLSPFRCGENRSFEFACNWKLAVENYCDYYHVFKVHPALNSMMSEADRGSMQLEGPHLFNEYELAGEGHGIAIDEEARSLPMIPDLPEPLQARMIYGALFPNVCINVYPTNLQFVWFEPKSADRTTMHMWFYVVEGALDSEEHRAASRKVADEWASLNAEDEGVCRRLQDGRQSGAYDGGRFAPHWDRGTAHFHKTVAQAVRGEGIFTSDTDVA